MRFRHQDDIHDCRQDPQTSAKGIQMKTQSISAKRRISGWRARFVGMALFAVVAGGVLAATPASASSTSGPAPLVRYLSVLNP